MAAGIQQLIDKEREAENMIKDATLNKEETRKKAAVDAEFALGIIQTEHDRKIEEMEKESEKRLEKLRRELKEEYESYAKLLEEKETAQTVEGIIRIITGKTKDFD